MPRYETYHDVQKNRRHGVKPYDPDDVNPNQEYDDANENDDADDHETNDNDNIFNPKRFSGELHRHGPPPENSYGRNDDDWKQRLADRGFNYSTEPPSEEYLERDREYGVHYHHPNGLGHVVAADGGFNQASRTYTDHQIQPDEDVTNEVRRAEAEGRIAGYVIRDTFDDKDRKLNEGYDSPEEERRDGPVDDPDYDDDGGCEMDEHKREHIRWYTHRG